MPSPFVNFAGFANTVRRATFDKSAARAAADFASTSIAADGGYAVPVDHVNEIFMGDVQALMPLCQVIPAKSGSVTIPTDETTPWANTGIIAEWDDEGEVGAQRKPALSSAEHRLRKLRVLVPVTDELADDAPALAAWLPQAMRRAVTWKINDAILNGPGTARPLGILNSGALVTVAAETSQAAGTIVAKNVAAMLGRALDPTSATWIIHPESYTQVAALDNFDSATGRLAGRPIIATDACQAVGTAGDIILANLAGYRIVSRGPAFSESSHLWFDQDVRAFRLTIRIDGQPILREPVTPPNSATTRSHFVALAPRA